MVQKGRRKLLVASVGLATVNYATVSCSDLSSTSGHLVAPPSFAGVTTTSGSTGVGGALVGAGGAHNTSDGVTSDGATSNGMTSNGMTSNAVTSGTGGGAGSGSECLGGAGGERDGAAGAAGECAD